MNLKYTISLLSLIILGACGPLGAHSSIAKAHIALEAAEAANAERYAVYEYRSAQLYIRKAKEEEGYSSFQEAIDFAKKATEFANKARGRALQNKKVKPRTFQEIQRSKIAPSGARAPAPAVQAPAPAPGLVPPPRPAAPAAPAPVN